MSTNILIKPIITEKSFELAQNSQFSFLVKKTSTKTTIAQEIESLFKVNVVKVRLQNKPGKTKRSGKKRLVSKTSPQKKAIVTLVKGQTIDYFKLPDEKDTSKKVKKSKTAVKATVPTPKSKPAKKGFLGFGKRKEQRTQDK